MHSSGLGDGGGAGTSRGCRAGKIMQLPWLVGWLVKEKFTCLGPGIFYDLKFYDFSLSTSTLEELGLRICYLYLKKYLRKEGGEK